LKEEKQYEDTGVRGNQAAWTKRKNRNKSLRRKEKVAPSNVGEDRSEKTLGRVRRPATGERPPSTPRGPLEGSFSSGIEDEEPRLEKKKAKSGRKKSAIFGRVKGDNKAPALKEIGRGIGGGRKGGVIKTELGMTYLKKKGPEGMRNSEKKGGHYARRQGVPSAGKKSDDSSEGSGAGMV